MGVLWCWSTHERRGAVCVIDLACYAIRSRRCISFFSFQKCPPEYVRVVTRAKLMFLVDDSHIPCLRQCCRHHRRMRPVHNLNRSTPYPWSEAQHLNIGSHRTRIITTPHRMVSDGRTYNRRLQSLSTEQENTGSSTIAAEKRAGPPGHVH